MLCFVEGGGSTDRAGGACRRVCGVELSFWLHIYTARLFILTNKPKAAKKEIKGALQVNVAPTHAYCMRIEPLNSVYVCLFVLLCSCVDLQSG